MYLSRVFLNPDSPLVQGDVIEPERLHKTLMRAFPDDVGESARRSLAVLYRLERGGPDGLALLLQSAGVPRFDRWPSGYLRVGGTPRESCETRALDRALAALRNGRRLSFRLRANTTKKVDTKSGPEGEHRNGRRVPVAGDEGRQAWLERRGLAAGFEVHPGLRIREIRPIGGRGRKHMTFAGADFDGALTVVDIDRFREAIVRGIGPGKAFGFGLLSIGPIR
jgi:CRISPR system Cascade subunit CasE